ncbi:hypothetical protein, partial [Aeromonas hydrophila]|uniref:hypothetical protein n=1 Tax=Aeromonas hydrophila TaxID=644 RepID=UPI003F66CDBF
LILQLWATRPAVLRHTPLSPRAACYCLACCQSGQKEYEKKAKVLKIGHHPITKWCDMQALGPIEL